MKLYAALNDVSIYIYYVIVGAEEIVENENESLTNDLKDLPFREVDAAVCKSTYSIGIITQKLEECLASYCDTTTSMCGKNKFLK